MRQKGKVLRATGKQPPALPSGRSVGKMPVAIWSESGAAGPAFTPTGCAANGPGARHSPSAWLCGERNGFPALVCTSVPGLEMANTLCLCKF